MSKGENTGNIFDSTTVGKDFSLIAFPQLAVTDRTRQEHRRGGAVREPIKFEREPNSNSDPSRQACRADVSLAQKPDSDFLCGSFPPISSKQWPVFIRSINGDSSQDWWNFDR
ncbi:Hypothetical protein NTJ_11592 [Nesidiocoris tenuis]|uniref:Uncharacterized protein n=1 Tax=Nesidiocoris tenuis TaxID=355587 RepID=A0ABN7B574_9HEMI|nr:Hypothetical protein NTJ_11592 [Nesidiocoris tenuis]